MKLLIHAGGYLLSPWRGNELNEIRVVRGEFRNAQRQIVACKWSPGTVDFAAAGVTSGGSSAAGDVAAMIQVIGSQAVESIEELRIIGHANKDVFSLAGDIRCDDVYFVNDAALIGDYPAFIAAVPKLRAVQDRFARDAKVILMGCNAGSGAEALLRVVSHAFLRTAAGYKEEIKYKFDYGPTQLPGGGLIVGGRNPTRVTVRGQMMYESFGQIMGTWQNNAWNLQPDATNNEGDIFIGTRDKDRVRGATTLFWMILREFYSPPYASAKHAWVSGCGADPSVPGIRVTYYKTMQSTQENGVTVQRAAGAHVHVNPDFAAKTTPTNLQKRVDEVGKALELVGAQTSGDVAVTW
jgi:hypothetical protein